MTYTKIKFYIISMFKIPRINNKKFRKRGLQGAPLLFLYEVSSNLILIYFTAILLTPGIFLIQIVNTNNTNMYLLNLHNKNNLKMHFPKSWVFKGSNPLQTFIIHRNAEINCIDISKVYNDVSLEYLIQN